MLNSKHSATDATNRQKSLKNSCVWIAIVQSLSS